MRHTIRRWTFGETHPGSIDQRRRSRPGLEALEGRVVMSVGKELAVSAAPAAISGTASASSANGSALAVWAEQIPGGGSRVVAQRLGHSGNAVTKVGAPIVVDLQSKVSSTSDSVPSVAMDGQGNFVVSWTSTVTKMKSSTSSITARRFNASGAALGAAFGVSAAGQPATASHAAMDTSGDFVISYTAYNGAATGQDIEARLYNPGGVLQKAIKVANSKLDETSSSVAMSAGGLFDVVYESAVSSTNHDITLNRYSVNGAPLSTVSVAASSAMESAPSVSMDNNANAVVAYQKGFDKSGDYFINVEARRVPSKGAAGAEISIASSANYQLTPSVALSRAGGAFAVAYVSTPALGDLYSPTGYVVEVSAKDKPAGPLVLGGYRIGPAISIDGSQNYTIVAEGDFGANNTAYAWHGVLK
jgi:hypothetical protein